MDFLVDVLTESVIDTLKLIPFLFLTYLAMEALEHSASHHVRAAVEKSGKAGPVVGSILGALPQCGFSAMAATLYAGRVVTTGTLVAVILSTSDEMIPVFVAHQESPTRLFGILALKVIVGIIAGLLVDVALRMLHRTGDGHPHIHELCERAHCHCEDVEDENGSAEAESEAQAATAGEHDGVARRAHEHAHGHDHHGHGHGLWPIVRSALVHTVQVTVFIFLVTFVFGLLIEGVGEDAIGELLADHPVRATFIAALVGLIPNCGASVALTELFLDGTLAAGPMVAGLLVSGGVGLLVLWRTNADLRQNAAVTGVVYAVGVAVGLLVGATGMMF